MPPLNRTALYLRLSRDDEKTGESLSIENQRMILRRFTAENGGTIADEYVDDGWSGTNFERPGVKRLLDDAKDGKIDTVVVKDLSRFGRNYIQVGQYIDYIFPAYGIRFIALSDNVDTADRTSAGMDMMPIMNVFNEWHAANTSKKIRAVLEAKWQAGRYTNWAYPYGYRVGADENRAAVIDEEAARVVRHIYDMRLKGASVRAIARALTDEGIPNPTAHYTRLDGKKSERRNSAAWSAKTVSCILKDQTYTGTLTQHRTTHFSYKNHTAVKVPESEYVIKKNAHEPIIPAEVWEKVQTVNGGAHGRADRDNIVHPLSGLLVCADCGKKLKGKRAGKNKTYMYCCRTYADLGKKYCSSHAISEKLLEHILLQDIRSLLGELKFDEEKAAEHFLHERAKRSERSRLAAEKQLRSLINRIAELNELIRSAFEEKVLGNLPESVCRSLCEKYLEEKEGAEKRTAELRSVPSGEDECDTGAEEYIARLKGYAGCGQLTRELCLQLIGRIAVGENPTDGEPRRIDIYYKAAPNAPLPSPRKD